MLVTVLQAKRIVEFDGKCPKDCTKASPRWQKAEGAPEGPQRKTMLAGVATENLVLLSSKSSNASGTFAQE